MGVYYACDENDSEYLEHYGIRGMKWGIRNFQYADGSLTPEGRERYGSGKKARSSKQVGRTIRDLNAQDKEMARLKGDAYLAERKYNIASKRGNTARADKWNSRRKEANRNLAQMERYTKGLTKNAKLGDMPISKIRTLRDAERWSDYFKQGLMASAMSIPMAYISPIGVGVGFSYSLKPDFYKGYHYMRSDSKKKRGTKI